MKVLSRGCSLWVVCGGKEIILTKFSLAKSINYKFLVWLKCPSNKSRTGSSKVGFVFLMKCWNHWVKMLVCTQPDGWATPTEPAGAPLISSCDMYFLGNITKGGIKSPVAFIAQFECCQRSSFR